MIAWLDILVGEHVGQGTLYLYELVGECVYLYVGQGRDGRGKVGRTNYDRGKDVVPKGGQKRQHPGVEPTRGAWKRGRGGH